MSDRPHPADYMTDAAYEQFRREGGVSDVTLEAGILNYSIDPDEELLVEQYSGAPEEVSDRVTEVLFDQYDVLETMTDAEDYLDERLGAGDWITIADGEVVELGEFHPFRVHVEVHS